MKRIFVHILLLIVTCAIATSVEARDREKVVLYYFKDLSASTDYSYYSYIIPDSIAVDLKRSKRFDVITFPVSADTLPKGATNDIRNSHIRMLSEKGREFSAAYIICGSYHIKNRRIFIDTQIFIVERQEIVEVSESSSELGTMLFAMIDSITKKINSELGRYAPHKAVDAPVMTSSPFYNFIRGTTFGMSYGTVKFQEEWGRYFDTASMAACHLSYDLNNIGLFRDIPVLSDLSLGAEYSFFNTKPISEYEHYLNMWGALISVSYQIRFTDLFIAGIWAGWGEAHTTYTIFPYSIDSGSNNNGPFVAPSQKKSSTDNYIGGGLSLNVILDPLVITSGISLRKIYNSPRPITFSVVSFGLGYRI